MRRTDGLAVAGLYLTLGAVGLTLAIPPGYASPVFPAAGLALAAALHLGRRAALFIIPASFALNIGQALLAGTLGLHTTAAAACIALGAALQAELGRRAVLQRLGESWARLESEASILSFLLWGGAVACLTSATVALTTLWVLGVINAPSIPLSWWTWYSGDLLGVAIFAPLALLFLSPKDELQSERKRRIVVPILVALALSMLLYAGATHLERRQVASRLEHDGAVIAKLVQDRLITHQTALASLAHFAEAHPGFDYLEFETFTHATLEENPDLFGLSFNDTVFRDELQAYEARISTLSPLGRFQAKERNADGQLVPVKPRDDYVLVRFIAPLAGNTAAVGFDIQSEPVRREAINRARKSGSIAVTQPLRLVQESAVRMGALLLFPMPERTGRQHGFAVAILKVDELIAIATRGQLPEGLRFSISDPQADDGMRHYFGTARSPELPAYRSWTTTLKLADRQWRFEAWAEEPYVHQSVFWLSWSLGAIALLFTSLLQVYLHGMTGRAMAIRRQNRQLIEKQSELLLAETVFDNISEAIVVTDANGVVLSVNPMFSRITGEQADDVVGRKANFFLSGAEDATFHESLWNRLQVDRRWQGEIVKQRTSGERYTALLTITAVLDEQGAVSQYVGTFSDITDRKAASAQIEFMAFHDALTELPNRALGRQRAQEALSRAMRHGQQVGIVFMDLDHFKLVNDTYGHSVGDQLLQLVASRLRQNVRAEDTVCRISGDEFMLILEYVQQAEDVATCCEQLLAELSRPYPIDGRLIQASMSMGIAMHPGDGESAEELLRKADTAMFEAKRAGRNTYCFFDRAMNQSVVEFVETRDALLRALEHREFELHYQPQVCLADGNVRGAEALIRWHHPQRGLLGPEDIIAVAEGSGLIVPIGAWALQEACRQMKAWVDMGLPVQTLAVNLSAVQFRTGNIQSTVAGALAAAGLAARHLELELTESILITNKDEALRSVQALKACGVRLSIDDFGTGYSSMAYLKRFNVDKLKIDASFASDVVHDAEDAAIVRSIIQMAQAMHLETTAEGVTDAGAVEVLREMGCTMVQGFYFAPPMPRMAFETWVRNRQQQGAGHEGTIDRGSPGDP